MSVTVERPYQRYLTDLLPQIIQEAGQGFTHPYLTPTPREGVYGGMMWDWDSLLCAYGYMAIDPNRATEALQGVVLNILEHLGPSGNSAMCLVASVDHFGVPQDPPPCGTIRPVVGQMARLVCHQLQQQGEQDPYAWLRPVWPKLKRLVDHYHRYRRHNDLYVWCNAWESLSDNNPALWDYPAFGVQACDMTGFVDQDFRAMAQLATKLGDDDAAYDYQLWSDKLRVACREQLWDADAQSCFNRIIEDGSLIQRISYTNFGPLWGGVLDPNNDEQAAMARAMIERYLIAEDHLWCPHGIRTASPVDPDYNTEATHTPSNWRGPVWFVANYLCALALRRYGYQSHAEQVCQRTLALLDKNIESHGFVTENFHPETGDNLVADRFVSWTSIALRFEQDIASGQDLFAITL